MIFDTNFESNSALYSLEGVRESQYDLGIGGALMHVWENECNYNALMRAVGLSEMKYCMQNEGANLFVNEAGAMSGFIAKVKGFFLKVIEKIKSIFKKFMATINSFVMDDKNFVKKYKKDTLDKAASLKDFQFKGFVGLKDGDIFKLTIKNAPGVKHVTGGDPKSSDSIEEIKDKNRASIIGENSGMDSGEFRDKLKEKMYGDKEDFDVNHSVVSKAFDIIENTKSLIEKADKSQKEAIDAINTFIKNLEEGNKKFIDDKHSGESEDDSKFRANNQQNLSNTISIWKTYADDITVAYGAYTGALKDARRQAKALCVKVLGAKKQEAATLESGNIFDSVDFA